MINAVYRRAADLMEADLGDELVGLDVASGKCFGFNDVAASIWRHLDQPRSFDQLRDALSSEYEVDPEQCSADLGELLDDLIDKGLIVSADAGSGRNI